MTFTRLKMTQCTTCGDDFDNQDMMWWESELCDTCLEADKFRKPITPRNNSYLKWLRTLPCTLCGREKIEGYLDIVPAHKGGGMALKGSGCEAVPLCVDCHEVEHEKPAWFWIRVVKEKRTSREAVVENLQKLYKERT